jgi:peptidoglycan/LPS O-acetylase OafA/YrhL
MGNPHSFLTKVHRIWQAGSRARRLGECCEGRDNNLILIRILAALAVQVFHAWSLTLVTDAMQPLFAATGSALGTQAVYVFFAISGFLVTRSFVRHPTRGGWITARTLRIFPGLAVALVVTALVAGRFLSALPPDVYPRAPKTWSYVPRGLSLAWRQAGLPGVFGS